MKKIQRDLKLSQERWELVTENVELIDKVLFFLSPKYRNINEDVDEYKEAAMEGLIHAARKFDFDRNTAKFSTYAITIMRRDVIKKYRKNAQLKNRFKSRETFQETFLDSEEVLYSNDTGVLENIEKKERIEGLKGLLKNLPEKEKKIIQMYTFENKKFAEIGKTFNVTGEMARLYYKNILKKLKNKMEVLV